MPTEKKKKKRRSRGKKGVILKAPWITIVLALVIVAVVLIAAFVPRKPPQEPQVISQALLEEIIEVSDLATYEAIYNGIATVMDEKKQEKVSYHVSYEAIVEVGFDFQDIDVTLNEEEKKVVITIPTVEIINVSVDFTSMDFIFMDDRANTETVSEVAYKACEADAIRESRDQRAILELAQQNAVNYMDALIRPFVEQMDSEYKIEIRQEGQV